MNCKTGQVSRLVVRTLVAPANDTCPYEGRICSSFFSLAPMTS